MRQFRGKSIATGEWVEGCRFGYKHDSKVYIVLNEYSADELRQDPKLFYEGFAWHQVDPATVGQSTGRKDKNGVEIYGKDRVECHEDQALPPFIGIIEYEENHCAWWIHDETTQEAFYLYDLGPDSTLEVVHDKPEPIK